MTQYFSIARISESCRHLARFDSKWVLVPFIMACNGVRSQSAYVDLGDRKGTDKLLQEFFDGELLGLAPLDPTLPHHVRPFFADLRRGKQKGPFAKDLIVRGKRHIWGNNYTQLVSKAPATYGLERRPNETDGWKLAPNFAQLFDKALEGFQFEELLIWLHAFSGFADTILGWADLLATFSADHVYGGAIPSDYNLHFSLTAPSVPWPKDMQLSRPSNTDLQKALIPSAITVQGHAPSAPTPLGPLLKEDWQAVLTQLKALLKGAFVGLDVEADSLATQVVVGLASCKRIFLLGDPGTGKSELAKLIEMAFRAHLADRLRAISVDVTDKTSETVLTGFLGLDGDWVYGRLTASDSEGSLLRRREPENNGSVEDGQVNLITLNEANRRDVEALLSLFQTSLDSASRDPLNDSHEIRLGRSGTHLLSPDTYIVMTGNSPRDDIGREPQSRPLQRRVAVVWLPNPLAEVLARTPDDFRSACSDLWTKCGQDCIADDPQFFADALTTQEGRTILGELRSVLEIVHQYGAGLSFGLLRKLLIMAANEMTLSGTLFNAGLDTAVVNGVGPALASAQPKAGVSPRRALLEALGEHPAALIRFREWAQTTLTDANAFGTIDPAF